MRKRRANETESPAPVILVPTPDLVPRSRRPAIGRKNYFHKATLLSFFQNANKNSASERAAVAVIELLNTVTEEQMMEAAAVRAPLATIRSGELFGINNFVLLWELLGLTVEVPEGGVQLLIESTVTRNLIRKAVGANLVGSFFKNDRGTGFENRNPFF